MSQSKHPQSAPKEPPAIEKPPQIDVDAVLLSLLLPPPPKIETIYAPLGTVCERAPADAPAELIVSFTIKEGLQLHQHTYLVGQPGKEVIMDGVAGGIVFPEK